jgi:hypothetical protein
MNDKSPMHSPTTDDEPRGRIVGLSDKWNLNRCCVSSKPVFPVEVDYFRSARDPGTISLMCSISERERALSESVRESISAHASSKFLRHRVRFQMDMLSRGSTRTPLAACRIVRTRQVLFHRGKACISSPDRRRSCTSLDAAEV